MTDLTPKLAITQAVLDQIPESHRIDLQAARKTWWLNIRAQGGLRLTDVGHTMFTLADIEYFDFEFKPTKHVEGFLSWQQFTLELNYKIKCPYYIGREATPLRTYLRVYDSKVAMMINLYGDVYEFMKQTKRRNK